MARKKPPIDNPNNPGAKHATALKALAPVAKEINVRYEKAGKLESDAADHRLAAALQLATAESQCAKAKLKFKGWCTDNITQMSFETARKLLAIGQAKDPTKAMKDSRKSNAERNKVHRRKNKDNSATEETSPPTSAPSNPLTGPGATVLAYEAAASKVSALSDNEKIAVLEMTASELGRRVLTSEEVARLQHFEKRVTRLESPEGIIDAFKALIPDQREFVQRYLVALRAKEISGAGESENSEGDGLGIPEFLKQTDKPMTDKPAAPAKAPRKRRTTAKE